MELHCKKCDRTLDAEKHFDPRRDSGRGYQYECKDCRKEIHAKRNAKRREDRKREAEKKPPVKKRVRTEEAQQTYANTRRKLCRQKQLERAAEQIKKGLVVAESKRPFGFLLRAIMEQQLHAFYDSDDLSQSGKIKLNGIIEDALFEVKEALSRVSKRVKALRLTSVSEVNLDELKVKLAKGEALDRMGLTEAASDEEIKKAYKEQALSAHPDMGGCEGQMQQLNDDLSTLIGGK